MSLLALSVVKMALLQYRTLSSNTCVSLAPLLQHLFRQSYGRSSIRVADKTPLGNGGISSNTSRLVRFRAFCTSQDLSIKKCVPCSAKDLRPMTEGAADILIKKVPEWNLLREDGVQKLQRSWKVKTFVKGMEFLRLVAEVAEAEGHHPDLHLVGWNNVKIDIWTHAVGGLTENDFILATKIDRLNLHHLLRITPTNH